MKELERVQSVASETAVLVRVVIAGDGFTEDPLEELRGLATTAGTSVVAGLVQRRTVPDVTTYLGKGKVDELKALVEEHSADVVIFDNDLNPGQTRNLEQALAKRGVVDHRADIYSLGVTLYELLTLQPDYRAEDRRQLLKQIAFEEPAKLRRVDPNIPRDIETIVHTAMSKDMDHRYSSAQEVAADLRSHLENRPIAAKPPKTWEAIVKWTRRNPSLAWATIITLLLITTTLAASTLLISKQLARATKAEREAQTAQGEALAQARELARRNYLLHIASADNALLRNEYLHAQTELDECSPEQRGREWHYLVQCLHTRFPVSLPGSEQPVFTHDGKRLLAIGAYHSPERRRVRTWDLESGEVVDELRHDSQLACLAVSSDEKRIAAGDVLGNLIVWDAKSGDNPWPPVKVHH
ncbi:MAG: hypothetical protein JJ992_27925, partial [Planctomycetes bacterium]|nr:hypothetical protein [Planctomycetota bacterium]